MQKLRHGYVEFQLENKHLFNLPCVELQLLETARLLTRRTSIDADYTLRVGNTPSFSRFLHAGEGVWSQLHASGCSPATTPPPRHPVLATLQVRYHANTGTVTKHQASGRHARSSHFVCVTQHREWAVHRGKHRASGSRGLCDMRSLRALT